MDDDSVSGISAMRHKISIIVADKHWSKIDFFVASLKSTKMDVDSNGEKVEMCLKCKWISMEKNTYL